MVKHTSNGGQGSLVVVGVGIGGLQQITPETTAFMQGAELLLYLVLDPLTEFFLKSLNKNAVSLQDLYGTGKPRRKTYDEMVERIMAAVLSGQKVCVAFYGHPGVLVNASRRVLRLVTRAGLPAKMIPAISAEACLYADLDLDPGTHGVQSYEATDFLLHRRRIDPTSALILWQIGVLGESITRDPSKPYRSDRMAVLIGRLARDYPLTHRVILYQAATFPGAPPQISRVALRSLARTSIPPVTTLYVPARPQRQVDPRVANWLKETA